MSANVVLGKIASGAGRCCPEAAYDAAVIGCALKVFEGKSDV